MLARVQLAAQQRCAVGAGRTKGEEGHVWAVGDIGDVVVSDLLHRCGSGSGQQQYKKTRVPAAFPCTSTARRLRRRPPPAHHAALARAPVPA